MKRHLFYTFLTIFGLTAVVTLLGITRVIVIEEFYLKGLFGAFIVELAGAVVALYRKAEFFEAEATAPSPKEISPPASSRSDTVTAHDRSTLALPPPSASDSGLTQISQHTSSVQALKQYIKEAESEVPAAELDRSRIAQRFIGAKVSWVVSVQSVTLRGSDTAVVEAMGEAAIAFVNSDSMSLAVHPDLRFLKLGDLVVMSGRIAEITTIGFFTVNLMEVTVALSKRPGA